MLNDYKQLYKQSAALVPEWKQMSQLDLAIKCAEKGPLYENYLSALILKFWHIIDRNLYRDKGLYEESTAHDWYINSILFLINDKPWEDPKSTVYKDPKAVEKILNTCVNCDRANWFQASNRHKRRINHGLSSLEMLTEAYGDSFLPEGVTDETDFDSYKDLVLHYFKEQKYLLSLIIDVLVNDVSTEIIHDDKGLVNGIKKSIKSLPPDYTRLFAKNYNLDEDIVKKSFSYIYKMSDTKLKTSIENYIYKLRTVLGKDR